jgi:DHA3 family multidrug efflux protein-like MFS transporter
VTSFLIAPIAEFAIIPYMEGSEGRATWGWLLGDGQSRGIALVFVFAGLVMVIAASLAFLTRSYRILSQQYRTAEVNADVAEHPTDQVGDGAEDASSSVEMPEAASRGMRGSAPAPASDEPRA